MELKGSQTEKNLKASFGGESMARNKYTFFAEKARKENHTEIAELFERMAKNESVHAQLLYTAYNGNIGDSMANLKDAMSGEYGEWSSMYPDFAKKAEEEGFTEIAEMFRKIAAIEKDHEQSFLIALTELMRSSKKTTEKSVEKEENSRMVTVQGYRCMFCGSVYEKREDVCSLCGAIGSFEPTQIQKRIG